MPFGIGPVLAKLDETLVGIANLRSQIGALRMSTQQDAENLAQAIAANTAAWQGWATSIENALTAAQAEITAQQQQIANGQAVDLTDAQSAIAAAQAAVGALPVETDPAPAPAPSTGS